jgi:hypothetical protein
MELRYTEGDKTNQTVVLNAKAGRKPALIPTVTQMRTSRTQMERSKRPRKQQAIIAVTHPPDVTGRRADSGVITRLEEHLPGGIGVTKSSKNANNAFPKLYVSEFAYTDNK